MIPWRSCAASWMSAGQVSTLMVLVMIQQLSLEPGTSYKPRSSHGCCRYAAHMDIAPCAWSPVNQVAHMPAHGLIVFGAACQKSGTRSCAYMLSLTFGASLQCSQVPSLHELCCQGPDWPPAGAQACQARRHAAGTCGRHQGTQVVRGRCQLACTAHCQTPSNHTIGHSTFCTCNAFPANHKLHAQARSHARWHAHALHMLGMGAVSLAQGFDWESPHAAWSRLAACTPLTC